MRLGGLDLALRARAGRDIGMVLIWNVNIGKIHAYYPV